MNNQLELDMRSLALYVAELNGASQPVAEGKPLPLVELTYSSDGKQWTAALYGLASTTTGQPPICRHSTFPGAIEGLVNLISGRRWLVAKINTTVGPMQIRDYGKPKQEAVTHVQV